MARKMGLTRRLGLLATMVAAANAWTFVWTDTDNNSHVETGQDTRSCSQMDMKRGGYYNWDPEDEDFCINMFPGDRCDPNERNGWSCPIWPDRHLGQDFVGSWLVNHKGEPLPNITTTSTAESSTTATSASSSAAGQSPPTVTVTSDPNPTSAPSNDDGSAEDPSDSGSSLSGGAIAGIVVGVVAGVAVMALFAFLAVRRRRRQQHPDSDEAPKMRSNSGGPQPPLSAGGVEAAPKYQAYHHPPELDADATSPAPAQSPAPTYEPYPPDKPDAGVAYGASRPPMPELPNTSPIHSQAVELDAADVKRSSAE